LIKNDVVWIALWNNQGILKIDKQDWQVFNSTNSNLTSQNIWAINSDKYNNIWIGTGHDDNSLSLMRFTELTGKICRQELIMS
jgi:ligand-binding sensor domain-containing protein